jgi:CMD domain protein
MSASTPDVIDLLVGIEKGTRLDLVRSQRPEARANAQNSYLALFAPEFPGNVTAEERFAVAVFVAGLHRDAATLEFYRSGFAKQKGRPEIAQAIDAEIAHGATHGPYGNYPKGPLSEEGDAGLIHRVSEASRKVLGSRLAAALEHAHLLVFRPRDASPVALQAFLDAGWSTTDIVTLSQLVAFLSFQIRVIVGLRALAASKNAAARLDRSARESAAALDNTLQESAK